jgi:hypothetical protein
VFQKYEKNFDQHVKGWALRACDEWGFPKPSAEYFEKIRKRLPSGLRATVGFGIDRGIVIASGCTFRIEGLAEAKGPYNWFSRDNVKCIPNPNWEYYIQVAEYIRLREMFGNSNHVLSFEDALMDIGVYRDGKLFVCCEIKEKSAQAKQLISGIKTYESAIDHSSPDRGNDPLRKAKYIVSKKPIFFYLVAIGVRYEFNVTFPKGKAFELREDLIPFVRVS